jgi:threonine dehydratase
VPDAVAQRARPLSAPTLDDIRQARQRIAGVAIRTPLVRLNAEAPGEVWLKLENLQPIGSFKLRGATNAMRLLPPERLERGVYTASAGNMAQGVAWGARLLGVPCDVVVPEHAPQTKLAAIERLGARVTKVPFDRWWQVLVEHRYEPLADRAFIHPVSDPAVIAGNGTIGLEILEDLADIDTIVVPYGGGGLSCGIATAVRSLEPRTKVYAAEVETAAPLAASLAVGAPHEAPRYSPSFVDGIGSKGVLAEMWPLARALLAGSLVSSLAEVAGGVRVLAERNRVIAEGAGAAGVAAAVAGRAGSGRIVCVVSGGNIDLAKLAVILRGEVP